MVSIRCVLVLLLLVLAAADAHAAEVAYPPGSRIGLVPAAGMVTSRNFFGFEDADSNVAVILVSLPGDAYAELNRTVTADALKKQGMTLESRETISVPTGNAFLVVGRQEVEKIKLRKMDPDRGRAGADCARDRAGPGQLARALSGCRHPHHAGVADHSQHRSGR